MATVRRATVADAAAIGDVHVRAWQAAYPGIMPDAFLAGLDPGQRAELWRRRLGEDPPDTDVLVAVDAGEIVGFVVAGPARDDDLSDVGEVHAINLAREAWGRGLGSALLRRAEEGLLARGYDEAVLWVARGNERARRFYERRGWRLDGHDRTQQVLGAVVEELRYRRSLAADRSPNRADPRLGRTGGP